MMRDNNIWKLILSGSPIAEDLVIDSSTLQKIPNGVSFHLNGNKYNGELQIVCDESDLSFTVSINDGAESKEVLAHIPFQELVAAIEENKNGASYSKEYLNQIIDDYGFTKI